MTGTAPFLRHYRFDGTPAARLERVLAVGRAFLTVSALVAIYLDPTQPARLAAVTYSVLLAYALYSLVVLAVVHSSVRLAPVHGRLLHGLDILWTAALTFVSEGPISPFFLFFLFVVLAAAYRWGFRETVATAAVTAGVFLIETAIAAAGPWNQAWFASSGFELNRTILRVTYLLLTGFLLGYLAEQEKQSRAEIAAIADAARQPRMDLGMGGSVAAMAERLLRTVDASAAVIVLQEYESSGAFLWCIERTPRADTSPAARRQELGPDEQARWLFQDPGGTWHARLPRKGGPAALRVTQPGEWPLRRVWCDLPDVLHADRACTTITACNMGLPDEWRGRVYLYDITKPYSLEQCLHFLAALAEHGAPALTNVFLLRRLRSQVSAAERARVARELHDGAIQALFGIDMKIEALRRGPQLTAADTDREIGEVQALLQREVLALRELMQALRPIRLDSGEQLPDVLASVVERFRRDTGIHARFVANGGPVGLHPAAALEIVRIVQEALVNVRKHSCARNVLVRLSRDNGHGRLVVEDDGHGFEFDGRLSSTELDTRRLGPAIIKERARIVGAELAIDSTPGVGARIELTFAEERRG